MSAEASCTPNGRPRILGVLGGMGAAATALFYQELVAHTDATCDQQHIDTLILSHASLPDRTQAILTGHEAPLEKALVKDALSLEELGDCVSGAATPEEALDLAELGRAIGDYLRTLPLPARRAFLCRYYYADSLAETARVCGISVPAVKSQLYRTRQGLRTYLEKEGFDI